MLRLFFSWLDQHSTVYWVIAGIVSALTLTRLLSNWRSPRETSRQGVIEAFAWLAFLLAWRWPWLLCAVEMNPDESQFIAGAIALTRDPVFWRAVEGTTSGPLNYYTLVPLHALGLPLDYFSARVVGLLFVWAGLLALQRSLRIVAERSVAGITTLAVAVMFATTTHPDFLHFSSEHFSLAAVPLSFWLILRARKEELPPTSILVCAAVIAGTMPWSKLQTGPLSAVLILWAATVARKRVASVVVLASGTLPSVIISVAALLSGQWQEMWQRYLLHNLTYVAESQPAIAAWLALAEHAIRQEAVCWLLGATTLALVAVLRRRESGRALANLGWPLALFIAAVVAVAVPKRDFVHYLLLLVFPSALLGGMAWAGAQEDWSQLARRAGLLVALFLTVAVPVGMRVRHGPPNMFGQFADHWRRPYFADGAVLRAVAIPTDYVAVWGWSPRTHVESGVPQATREPHTSWLILDSPLRDHFRGVYLSDFHRHRPAFFLDATGPGAFYFTSRGRTGHEIFPDLAREIARDYTLLLDAGFSRLYVRADRLGTLTLPPAEMANVAARSRQSEFLGVEPPMATHGDVQRKLLDREEVLAVHAPAAVEWRPEAHARSVELEYGFEAAALQAGQSDGVDLALELVENGHARRVFTRHFDPIHDRADVGRQRSRVVLPPGFHRDAVVRLIVTPGHDGNNAWDWLFLSRVALTTSDAFLSEQFPGFGRIPIRAEIAHADVLDEDQRHLLVLHSPTRLEFVLTGRERMLDWSYGMRPGSYLAGGETDGVEFLVSLETAANRRELARHHVDPRSREADRLEQSQRVELPPHAAGDRLVIVLGPAGSPAWDWAYISRLDLK